MENKKFIIRLGNMYLKYINIDYDSESNVSFTSDREDALILNEEKTKLFVEVLTAMFDGILFDTLIIFNDEEGEKYERNR